MKTSLFLQGSDLELEYDSNIVPLMINCTAFVREKLHEDKHYLRHPTFGFNKNRHDPWPLSTDLACLHCCESFSSRPLPIPRKHDVHRNVYFVYGIFCSVNCAKAYILEHETAISSQRMLIFNQMIRNVFEIKDPVKPAPPRIRLAKFGGDLSIHAFRTNFHHINCTIIEPPFIPSSLFVEEQQICMKDESPDNKFSMNSDSEVNQIHPVAIDQCHNALYTAFVDQRNEQKASKDSEIVVPKKSKKRAKKQPLEEDPVTEAPAKTKGTLNAFLTFK